MDVSAVKTWFEKHVTLDDKPYTLDLEQAKAVLDTHKNTIVTARAGSGKTRVIVAKVAYLVAIQKLRLDEIKIFVFNRSAAAEVNQRIADVRVDGKKLTQDTVKIASTFHKFALDLVKLSGQNPQIISEAEQTKLIQKLLNNYTWQHRIKLSPANQKELLSLVSNFITRAGQKFPGTEGIESLAYEVNYYIQKYNNNPNYEKYIKLHQIAFAIYQDYYQSIIPQIDFNILMHSAAKLLQKKDYRIEAKIKRYRYILVDEYQDFSYLFFNLIVMLRNNCPAAHLFVVGDDWQAINRFAGSDCTYFLDFPDYFPEDSQKINLLTNYRSDKRIVENANRFMLDKSQTYSKNKQKGARVKAFSNKRGKIKYIKPTKTKFDYDDIKEDGLGDGRYANILQEAVNQNSYSKHLKPEAFKLFKTTCKIIKHEKRKKQILLLHRHNFTSFEGLDLESFYYALKNYLCAENIMTATTFEQKVRIMTMHKSKGLEADVVILLEMNHEQVLSNHPHATIFELFDDTLANEKADQERLLYVALTRAKHKLYILSTDQKPPTR